MHATNKVCLAPASALGCHIIIWATLSANMQEVAQHPPTCCNTQTRAFSC